MEKSKKSLVSIIVPVYNSEKYISKCIHSILNQTYSNFELILINDGSKDNSLKIIKECEKEDNRIKVINQKNSGAAVTRNNGIEIASGKYLMFIDNDDYIDSDYIERFVNAIEENNYDVVIGGYRRVDDNKTMFELPAVESDFFKLLVVAPWAKIYNAKFIKDNDIKFLDYKIGEDAYFSLNLYSKTNKICYINYIGYNWYYNNESISNSSQRGFNSEVDLIFLLDKLVEITGVSDDIYKYYYVRYIVWYLLFSGKRASSKNFYEEYRRLFAWLDSKIPDYKKSKYIKKRIPGETKKNFWSVYIFLMLEKLHLVKLFAAIYCRG